MAVQMYELEVAITVLTSLFLWYFVVSMNLLSIEEGYTTRGAQSFLSFGYLLVTGF